MTCGSCSGQSARNDYLVTYRDGTSKRFTAADGGVAAARIESGKHPGSTFKAVPALK